ncbi:MAG: hypothetical protein FRX48_06746 [Lasallia pustulata]|uniref:Uncharacterized protein n=1 Tax=Lasallia pustulata TaxID=136370 RepID=A0A5M8PIG4_9LECA|nr:MAG: hypothetical protein FRX48_06746 [Lasallia pustulata]
MWFSASSSTRPKQLLILQAVHPPQSSSLVQTIEVQNGSTPSIEDVTAGWGGRMGTSSSGNVAMDLPNAGEGYEADEKDRGLHVGQIERRYREGLGFTARAEGILEG